MPTQGPSELQILCRIQRVRSLSTITAMGAIKINSWYLQFFTLLTQSDEARMSVCCLSWCRIICMIDSNIVVDWNFVGIDSSLFNKESVSRRRPLKMFLHKYQISCVSLAERAKSDKEDDNYLPTTFKTKSLDRLTFYILLLGVKDWRWWKG